jgi:ribonuclease HI
MINRGLRRPHTLRHAKHRELIKAIIQCTKDMASNGSSTCFIKVQAHVGIAGNEMADGLAKEAVGMTGKEPTAHNITTGADPCIQKHVLGLRQPTTPQVLSTRT